MSHRISFVLIIQTWQPISILAVCWRCWWRWSSGKTSLVSLVTREVHPVKGGPVTTTLNIRSWPPPHKGIWKGSCATPMLVRFKAQLYLKEAGWSPSTLYLSSDQFTFGAGSQMIQIYFWIKDASVASYNSVGWSLNRWTSMQDGYGSGGQSGHWPDSEWSENKPSKKFKEYIVWSLDKNDWSANMCWSNVITLRWYLPKATFSPQKETIQSNHN